ncbi:asparagine synthase-related protein [Geochorda subterranea]|uniref:asparagine synthase (glutamine-hydrolyzing) n=1 Tax=Geochorda subterranea TaxID=3109564 RepID=A0ABZ1BQC3_9FIRM|nr:asparagine synthase-related protein [Limnochorda sp. LNt]WRP14997.1 asparagine synthase-related protein [Limnochorda sp. LNt]
MAAIAGGIGRPSLETVRRMAAAIAHRGPGGARWSVWPETDPRVVLGHGRAGWTAADREVAGPSGAAEEDAALAAALVGGEGPSGALAGDDTGPGMLATRAAAAVRLLRATTGGYALAVWREDGQGGGWLALARDPIGIRPLYWARTREAVYFASEIKAIREASRTYRAFPPGRVAVLRITADGALQGPAWAATHRLPWETMRDAERPAGRAPERAGREAGPSVAAGAAVAGLEQEPEAALDRLETLLRAAVAARVEGDGPVGVLLSGGLDSSLVAALARSRVGGPLLSFAAGTPDSPDVEAAARVARALGLIHHVRLLTEADALRLLPEVVYRLESFDAPLVRSALANHLAAEAAAGRVGAVLSGEGSDELFAGYASLEGLEGPALERALSALMGLLADTGLQRVDRMAQAFGIEPRLPFLDWPLVAWAFAISPDLKRRHEGGRVVDKWLVRCLAARVLPAEAAAIATRPKQKFSQGSGAAGLLARLAEQAISEAEQRRLQARYPRLPLGSREQAWYLRLFLDAYPEPEAVDAVRLSRSVVPGEVA